MKDAQENSLQSQQDYFAEYIRHHPDWFFAGIYTDDGISGLSIRRREGFNRMVDDALDGKIDLILTKSLSRFARNTVDALTTIRNLKAAGVAVYFQKENINTADSTGEFLITLMSSFAEEESRSISENATWAVRHRYAQGIYYLPKRLLGSRSLLHPPPPAGRCGSDRVPPVREPDTPSEGQKGQILLFRPMPKCMVECPSGTGASESLLPSDL